MLYLMMHLTHFIYGYKVSVETRKEDNSVLHMGQYFSVN